MASKIINVIRTILLAPFITATGYLLLIMPRMKRRPGYKRFTLWHYAHRGLHNNATDAPENSMNAFKKAVDKGFGIELDVQLTKDDRIVVCHDFDIKRIAGVDKKIADMTYDELKSYKIMGTDSTVPLFTDVLELVDGKVPLIIEYKMPSFDTKICEMVDKILEGYRGMYMIESFHPIVSYWYKKNRPGIIRGILSSDYELGGGSDGAPKPVLLASKNLLFNFLIKPDFVAYDCRFYNNLSRVICKRLFKAPAVAWTIKSQDELEARADDYDMFIFEGFLPKE